jgi:bacteriocin biosynthesis cyclodehydratase domain-containing protein
MEVPNSEGAGMRINPAIEVIVLDDDRVQFFGANPSLTVNDKEGHIRALLEWCDGSRGHDEVLALLATRVIDGDKLLAYLIARKCLVSNADDGSSDPFTRLFTISRRPDISFGHVPEVAGEKVAVHGTGILQSEVLECLADLGIEPVARGDDGLKIADHRLRIVLSDWPDHAAFCRANRASLDAGATTLYASLDRGQGRVGPLVIPGESACFECFHHRLRSNFMFRAEFDSRMNGEGGSVERRQGSRLVARICSAMVGSAVVGFLTQDARLGRPNVVTEFDAFTNRSEVHPLLKLPRCPSCGKSWDALLESAYQPQLVS